MGLAAAALAGEEQVGAGGGEAGVEAGAEQDRAQAGLKREVELLDGLELGEAGLARAAHEARGGAVGDLLLGEGAQELVTGPLAVLGALDQLGEAAPGGSEVEALEQGGQSGGGWSETSCCSSGWKSRRHNSQFGAVVISGRRTGRPGDLKARKYKPWETARPECRAGLVSPGGEQPGGP